MMHKSTQGVAWQPRMDQSHHENQWVKLVGRPIGNKDKEYLLTQNCLTMEEVPPQKDYSSAKPQL